MLYGCPVSTSSRPRRRVTASAAATSAHARTDPRPYRITEDRASPPERLDNVSRVYNELRSLIIWGQLPPGARIAERVVAERLGASRTPVRSALHRLQQEGFVGSSGRAREQRLIVAPLTQHDGEELFIVVGHLEGLAARTAATLPAARRKVLVRRMRDLNRQLGAESRKRGDVARVFDLDLEFHRAYVEGVVGPRLLTLHRAIKPQCERYSRIYISVLIDELSASLREHDEIARCIADGDDAGAQLAAETNWHNAALRLTRVIGQHGERGSWHVWAPRPSPPLR